MLESPPAPAPEPDSPRLERLALALVLAMAALRVAVAALAPLSPDESYYWLWTRPVQLSYLDHPAMVAWWIWPSTRLLGDTPLGVRAPALLSSLGVAWLVWDTARLAWGSRAAGARAVIWLNATILFGAAAVLMTPDAPLALFWTASLWAVARLLREERIRWLYVLGVALGLGVLSKYTILLLTPGAVAAFVLFAPLRRWTTRAHFWLAILVGLLCTAPLVVWNLDNGFASIAKQFVHAFAGGVNRPLHNFWQFVAGQLGLATPLLLPLALLAMSWSLVEGWRARRADWFLLGATSLPVILFFTAHSFDTVVQAHWPGPAYIGAAVALGGAPFLARGSGRWLRPFAWAAPALGIALTLLVYFQAVTALLPIPPRNDPTGRLGGWDELAAAVERAQAAHPGAFLFVEKHEVAGELTFRLPGHPPVFRSGGEMRPPFTPPAAIAALKGRDGIYVTTVKEGGVHDYLPYFSKFTPLGDVALHWGGRVADRYRLILAEDYRGGVFVMGDGYPGAMDTK